MHTYIYNRCTTLFNQQHFLAISRRHHCRWRRPVASVVLYCVAVVLAEVDVTWTGIAGPDFYCYVGIDDACGLKCKNAAGEATTCAHIQTYLCMHECVNSEKKKCRNKREVRLQVTVEYMSSGCYKICSDTWWHKRAARPKTVMAVRICLLYLQFARKNKSSFYTHLPEYNIYMYIYIYAIYVYMYIWSIYVNK